MFESSGDVGFFDYLRIPYRVVHGTPAHPTPADHWLRVAGDPVSGHVYWSSPEGEPGRHVLDGTIPLFAAVTADAALAERLRPSGWRPLLAVTDSGGDHRASVWRHPDGSLLLPFDPAEAIANCWSERYHAVGSRSPVSVAMGLARRAYYRLRPLLPRRLQIRLRQRFSGVQERTTFPGWPVEPALHDLYDLLLNLLAGIAGAAVPHVSLWPHGHEWALVLTHDVETEVGYEHLHLLRDLESSRGMRSSWNFVPRRYRTHEHVVRDLQDAGFEVGVHGLHHDGRDLGSLRTFRRRLPEIDEYARRWGAVGFRSPALHRVWDWMRELPFDYDSSYPDTDPYEPIPGGCCSLLPYANGPLVELPITLAQDFVMFELLGHPDETLWVEKADYVRLRGGMALVLTHPDYMLATSRLEAYGRFLDAVRGDPRVWHALPLEVAAWWRRRSSSRLQRRDGGWAVVGPAAGEAQVAFSGDPAWVRRRSAHPLEERMTS